MKRVFVSTIMILAMLLISLAAPPASAGVEPSPFRLLENEVLNMVKGLSVAHHRLENVLTAKPGEAQGVLGKRSDVGELVSDYLGDLHPKLEEYVAALPEDVVRGRQADKVLEEGIFHVSGIVGTINDFLLNPDENPDREFIATLLDIRFKAEAVSFLLLDASQEVMGVEPSPFNPNAVRINDQGWDTEDQCFVLNLSMNRGLANAGKHAGLDILMTLYIVGVNPGDWDFVMLKIDDNGYDIDTNGWDRNGNFAPLEPLEIPWDRDGGTFTGTASVQTTVSTMGPSGNAMGHSAVYTSEVPIDPSPPETPPGGDSP